jgi:glycyl-tRNA synthetase (class II)
MSNWKNKQNQYQHITQVFQKYHINLTGPHFIDIICSLCRNEHPSIHMKHSNSTYDPVNHYQDPTTDVTKLTVFGSWMDIIGIKDRQINHSWHQDSGLDQITVMIGFPAENHYRGKESIRVNLSFYNLIYNFSCRINSPILII